MTFETVEEMRAEYRKLRRNACFWMARADFDAQVQAHIPAGCPAPIDYVNAAEQVSCTCERCDGTGQYAWGGTLNGKPCKTGTCYHCSGSGRMGQDDFRRCYGYICYMIVAACR